MDGDEDILMYTPSPPRVRGPRNKPENGVEKPEENTENEEDPPPEYHTPDEDHISPARRRKPAGYSPGGTLVPYQPPPEVQLAIDEIKKGRLDLDKYFSRTTIFGETGQPFTFKSSDFDSFKTPPFDLNDTSSHWVVEYKKRLEREKEKERMEIPQIEYQDKKRKIQCSNKHRGAPPTGK